MLRAFEAGRETALSRVVAETVKPLTRLTDQAFAQEYPQRTAYIMTQQPKLGAQLVHQPETYSADDFAFVFRKDQSALKDEVNAALAKLKSNGEYDKIYNKWFGKN